MTIAAGSRLGPYEILAPLGAGGMGEVYRARDTRLERTVAIKVLPQHLSSSSEVRQRFEREAKTISALSHPHICALYDVGNQDGVEFLVMEYLEGETLADRLSKGPLPLEQTLRYGIEIAGALDKAHRQGIVHRDLKPGNVMLTKSGVKLLDFGLAKAMAPAQPQSGLTSLPTMAGAPNLTQEGTILGTFQYMSPEQLEGKEADARSDIFALGAVLYEMATGKKAFTAASQASLIGAILHTDPAPISSVQPMSPPALDRTLKTCLAKDPDDRWQSAHDVASELRWIAEAGSQAGAPAVVVSRRRGRERMALALAAAATLAAFALAAALRRRPAEARFPLRAFIPAPKTAAFAFEGAGAGSLTVSPDGRYLTFSAAGADGASKLWLRPVGALAAEPILGTDDAQYPFWSPDSRFIAFFARGKLKKVSTTGGAAVEICDATSGARSGTWSREGVILFSPHWRESIHRVSAEGGSPERVTQLDEKRGETTHRWPWFLPDGRHFLYLAGRRHVEDTSGDNAIYIGSLGSAERRLLVRARSNIVYASGFLLYVRGRELVAHRFDPKRMALTGEPVAIADKIRYETGFFQGVFSASQTGLLAYQQGETATLSRLIWRDRAGKQVGVLSEAGSYWEVRLSPDARSAAVVMADPGDIWLFDLLRGIRTRFTFDPTVEAYPLWSPDGKTIFYSSDRSGFFQIYSRRVSGASGEERVPRGNKNETGTDISPDGRWLLYEREDPKGKNRTDLWVFPLSGEKKAAPLLETPFSEGDGRFSPDGRWLAYVSDESGRNEVYVAPFPRREEKWQISIGGGSAPRWRGDGKEIFYVAGNRNVYAVEVASGESFQPGTPRLLFSTRIFGNPSYYDVTPDGQKFIVNELNTADESEPITLVVDWTGTLEKEK